MHMHEFEFNPDKPNELLKQLHKLPPEEADAMIFILHGTGLVTEEAKRLWFISEFLSAFMRTSSVLPKLGGSLDPEDITQIELVRLAQAISRPELHEAIGGMCLREVGNDFEGLDPKVREGMMMIASGAMPNRGRVHDSMVEFERKLLEFHENNRPEIPDTPEEVADE